MIFLSQLSLKTVGYYLHQILYIMKNRWTIYFLRVLHLPVLQRYCNNNTQRTADLLNARTKRELLLVELRKVLRAQRFEQLLSTRIRHAGTTLNERQVCDRVVTGRCSGKQRRLQERNHAHAVIYLQVC